MSRNQNAGKYKNIKMVPISFEYVAKFKHFGN